MAYNVLIVDDSANMRSIIAKAVRLSGVPVGEVMMGSNGAEALEILRREWVDIVLADLNMPVMGGIELVERMVHEGIVGQVPVVIISTESRKKVIEWMLSTGVTAFLRKPFSPEELGALIETILGDPPAEKPSDDLFATAFMEALEGFAMLLGDVTGGADVPEEAVLAQVRFVGAGVEGDVLLAACPDTCQTISHSATGEECGDGADALAELANVTAGQLVDRIDGGPFALHPPERESLAGTAAWERVGAQDEWSVFDVEGRAIVAGVTMRKRW